MSRLWQELTLDAFPIPEASGILPRKPGMAKVQIFTTFYRLGGPDPPQDILKAMDSRPLHP